MTVLRITVPTTLADRHAERLARNEPPRRKRATGLLTGQPFTIEQPMALRKRLQREAQQAD